MTLVRAGAQHDAAKDHSVHITCAGVAIVARGELIAEAIALAIMGTVCTTAARPGRHTTRPGRRTARSADRARGSDPSTRWQEKAEQGQ